MRRSIAILSLTLLVAGCKCWPVTEQVPVYKTVTNMVWIYSDDGKFLNMFEQVSLIEVVKPKRQLPKPFLHGLN